MTTLNQKGLVWLGLVVLIATSLGACATSDATPSSPIESETLVRNIKVYESPT